MATYAGIVSPGEHRAWITDLDGKVDSKVGLNGFDEICSIGLQRSRWIVDCVLWINLFCLFFFLRRLLHTKIITGNLILLGIVLKGGVEFKIFEEFQFFCRV